MATTEEDGWITDPDVLKVVVELRGIQVGDFYGWQSDAASAGHRVQSDVHLETLYKLFDSQGWKLARWKPKTAG